MVRPEVAVGAIRIVVVHREHAATVRVAGAPISPADILREYVTVAAGKYDRARLVHGHTLAVRQVVGQAARGG
jgi:hypothetical protein